MTVSNCRLNGGIIVSGGAQHVQLLDNQIKFGVASPNALGIWLFNSSLVTVTGNTIQMPTAGASNAGIYSQNGNHNTISQNQIDGSWDGNRPTWESQGADDGIIVTNDDSDIVQANSIRNVFDAGVESNTILTNTLIANNTVTNAGFAGIASYHGTSWTSNTVRDNQVSQTPSLVYIFWADDGTGFVTPNSPSTTSINFVSNTFSGNTLQSSVSFPPVQSGRHVTSLLVNFMGINEGPTPLPLPFTARNNIIANNNFLPSIAGPLVFPTQNFVDGGGNTCNPNNRGNLVTCGSATVMDVAVLHPIDVAPMPRRYMPSLPVFSRPLARAAR